VHDRPGDPLPSPALRTYHAAGEFRQAHDMSMAQPWLLVMLGSAIGGGVRLWLSTAVARPLGTRFPWGTLTVNLLGCLLVGILGAVLAPPGRMHDAQPLRIFLVVGVLGGFTTFSAFALDAHAGSARGRRCGSGLRACLGAGMLARGGRRLCGRRYRTAVGNILPGSSPLTAARPRSRAAPAGRSRCFARRDAARPPRRDSHRRHRAGLRVAAPRRGCGSR